MKILVPDAPRLLLLLILLPIERQRTELDILRFQFPRSTQALKGEAPLQEISFCRAYLKFPQFCLSSPNLFQSQKFSSQLQDRDSCMRLILLLLCFISATLAIPCLKSCQQNGQTCSQSNACKQILNHCKHQTLSDTLACYESSNSLYIQEYSRCIRQFCNKEIELEQSRKQQ